jgi:AraC-like DNA-binding protein/ligand-binding sensor protein
MNASHPIPSSTDIPHDRREDVVARLQQSQLFRDYQDAFQTATGLPLVLRAVGSFQPPLHGSKKIASFCALMGGTSKTCAACLQLQARVEAESVTEPKTLQCFAGLSESVVPIRLGEKVIGYLQTGQVLLRPPTEKSFRAAMAELEKWKTTVDLAQLHAAYFETRVLTTKRYSAVLRLLSSFAHHLSLVSNELMITQASSEPPAVAKARAFIAENLGETLSLEQVARAANMSPFYFCKIFKSATGLTFTDYVARARVEQTKHLLLNPQVRVSEAAYEAGFQSLSQFNRVFRRVEGQAPSSYREHLHGSERAGKTRATFAFAA